jgi:hypothetical protein
MKIASKRTLNDMDIAADWQRLFCEAERREARRAANELPRPT